MSDPNNYTVGWICAINTEYVAAQAFLDEKHEGPEYLSPQNKNDYALGAARVAEDMMHSFPNIRIGFMVGIGGGAPSPNNDIRLGDVVVSIPSNGQSGVIQYDFGKTIQGQTFQPTGFLDQPPTVLRAAVNGLRAQYEMDGHRLEEAVNEAIERKPRLRKRYMRPDVESDRLYRSHVVHPLEDESTCVVGCGDDPTTLISRNPRSQDEDNPAIHYGLIASANQLMKDALIRDRAIAEKGVLCFEMEAAGLMNHFPCLIIRGICDYCDSHKNKEWQRYAAMVAAAYAKDLLSRIIPQQVEREERILDLLRPRIDHVVETTDRIDQNFSLNRLPIAQGAEFDSYMNQYEDECHPGTRVNILYQIREWAFSPHGKCIFWLNGVAGTGKSTISRTVAKTLQETSQLGASFFFKRGEGDRGNAKTLFPTIARQLVARIPQLRLGVQKAVSDDSSLAEKSLKEQFDKLILQPLLNLEQPSKQIPTMVVVLDALNECDVDNDIRVILQLLPRLQGLITVNLRIFLTSRPDLPIRLGFSEIRNQDYQDLVLHEIPEAVTAHDISLFLNWRLSKIRKDRSLPIQWPRDKDIEALVTLSVPLFIFAATVCRILEDPQWDPVDSLTEILTYRSEESQLSGTYLPVLNQLVKPYNGKRRRQLVQEFQEIVGTIVTLESPLSITSLSKLIGVSVERINLRLTTLHSVIRIPKDKNIPIRPFHLSLRDFLLDPEAREKTPLWVNEKEIHQRLAKQCLDICESLRRNICGLSSEGTERVKVDRQTMDQSLSPELQYACRYWASHLVKCTDLNYTMHSALFLFLKRHFLHWVETMSLLGLLSEVVGILDIVQASTSRDHQSTLYDFLHDAKRFVLQFRQIVDDAPLQVYYSGLVFSPRMAIIRREFRDELPTWISLLPRVDERWSLELQTLKGHSGIVTSVAFSPDGQLLASGSYDDTVRLWDPATGALQLILEGHSDSVTSVGFSPNSQLLASGSDDNTVRLWDLTTGAPQLTLEGHSDSVTSVAFSPDNRLLASGSEDNAVRLWDLTTGAPPLTLEGHSDSVTSVGFSPNSQLLASGSDDNTVRLWDLVTGAQLTLEGHSGIVTSVTFSPDGRLLASGSWDNTVRLWDPSTGGLYHTWNVGGLVNTLQFSPDGLYLRTNLGLLDVQSTCGNHTSGPTHKIPDIFIDQGQWIELDGDKVLWLPTRSRPTCSATNGSILALGHESGRVSIIGFRV